MLWGLSGLWKVGKVKEVMWCVSRCIYHISSISCTMQLWLLYICQYPDLIYTWHWILRYLACPCIFFWSGALLSWILVFFVFMWPWSVLNEHISQGTSREPNEWPPKVTASHWMMVTKTRRLQLQLSSEKNLGCLGYIGDYTTQLCGDYNKPL